MRARQVGLLAALSAGLMLVAAPAGGARTAASSAGTRPAPIRPVISCATIASADLTQVDARIDSATTVARHGSQYCDVTGTRLPNTKFEVLLPTATWQGDYLQQGCGGFCGMVGTSIKDPSRTSGYQAPFGPLSNGKMVVAADDQGHEADVAPGGSWGRTDLRARLVFGYLSEHQLARTAKALMRTYYGRGPSYSYFDGVSDGGHEALDLAQRFPTDFDGIIAGAPAGNWAPLAGLFETWVAAVNQDATGHQILTAEKLPALHAAVMAACADAHGVIEDPRACTFDPAVLRCPTGTDDTTCLTDAQVQVVRKEYRGPTDAQGRNLYDGGEPYGSELAWAGWVVMPAADTAAPGDTAGAQLGLAYLNDLGFWPNPSPPYTLATVPFTAAFHRALERIGGIYNATDPDLSAFRAHGGKIIIYHGWADQGIPPFGTLDYYRAVERTAGGFASSQTFSRLYMIPGLYHCPCGQPVDGDPATTVQFMPQLTAWVEHGQAPDTLTLPVTAQTTGTPLDSLQIAPVDARQPAPRSDGLNSNYRYVGVRSAFQPGNELWCTAARTTLSCATRR